MHLPHIPKPTNCVSYAHQSKFFVYNQLAKYKQKTENRAFETHIHEIGLYYVMTSFEFIHHSGNGMSSSAHCIVGFSALGWGGMLHISANAVG